MDVEIRWDAMGLLSMVKTQMVAIAGSTWGRPSALKALVISLVTTEAARINLYGADLDVVGRTSWPSWIRTQTRTTSGVSGCSSKSTPERKTHVTRG